MDYAFEIRRELFHIILGIAIIESFINFGSKTMWLLFFALVFGMTVSLLSLKYRLPFFGYMLDKFERPEYRKRFPGKGTLFFIAGSLLVLRLFNSNIDIALAAIAILAFGDSFSHIIGLTKNNQDKFNKKSILDTIAGIIFATIASSYFINLSLALAGSVVAMTAEKFSIKVGLERVDDNIIVPLIAGTTIYLLMRYSVF